MGLLIGFTALLVGLNDAHADASEIIAIKRACTRTELVVFSDAVPKSFQAEYRKFLSHSISSTRAFSMALALRKLSADETARAFAEYWISRTLLESGLMHLSFRAFRTLLAKPATLENASLQGAALECLASLHEQYPSLDMDPTLVRKVFELSPMMKESTRHRQAIQPGLWAAAVSLALTSADYTGAEVQVLARAVEDQPRAEAFIKALFAHQRGAYPDAIPGFKKFLTTSGAPARLDKHMDRARFLLAHGLYATGKFDEAARQLTLIPKNSPLLHEALTELAWAHLMAGRQREAIGVAMSLNSGGMRRAFAPEGPMVLAIGLNELCHYPEAIRATQVFKQKYQKIHEWLVDHEKQAPYPLVVAFLKKSGEKIPAPIVNEWLRSPAFLTRQEDINLTLAEPARAEKASEAAANEQSDLAADILKRAQAFRLAYQLAKKEETGPKGSASRRVANFKDDLPELKEQIRMYRRFQLAAPVWRQVLEGDTKASGPRSAALIQSINRDLSKLNTTMRKKIEEIAENNYFVEVEIYQGASRDLVWQESHPDYREIAEDIRDADAPKNHQVWKWGSATLHADPDTEEVWEDELGSFQANLVDNCTSKEKYLAIKQEQIVRRMKQ